eukprot:XP_020397192.1 artemin-like [Zea mays]
MGRCAPRRQRRGRAAASAQGPTGPGRRAAAVACRARATASAPPPRACRKGPCRPRHAPLGGRTARAPGMEGSRARTRAGAMAWTAMAACRGRDLAECRAAGCRACALGRGHLPVCRGGHWGLDEGNARQGRAYAYGAARPPPGTAPVVPAPCRGEARA